MVQGKAVREAENCRVGLKLEQAGTYPINAEQWYIQELQQLQKYMMPIFLVWEILMYRQNNWYFHRKNLMS